MVEIERKFLVKSDKFKEEATSFYVIKQGFLSTDPERVVRIRRVADEAFITVKGKSNKEGTTRFEWEKNISIEDADNLLKICDNTVIEKTRYLIPEKGGLCFEVDEFLGKNKGLIIAEIELPNEDHSFKKPTWLCKEVTGDVKYYNSMLSQNPFCNW
ncbi:MAG: CYTH domain-containing protein [Flavobacteriaceae bacterium]|nr:CYTH domain-containing protein [Flavobacteriaceae bacterium]